MRILVIGARIVGRHCLKAMLEAGADIAALLYLDDAKAGVTVAHCDFSDLIETHNLNARPFRGLKGEEGETHLAFAAEAKPDLGIVVGVSELIGDAMLCLPPKGFIGMHPALLPKGRGRAPIPWALIHDLSHTGVSLFYADQGADTGDILDQHIVPIYDSDTAATLGARSDDVAAELFVRNLPLLANGTAKRIKQDDSQATVWPRRRPEDGIVDWSKPTRAQYNWVRALTHPYPGAFTFVGGRQLFIWKAMPGEGGGAPGTILALHDDGSAQVATADGALRLLSVQWEGGAEQTPRAAGLTAGQLLGDA